MDIDTATDLLMETGVLPEGGFFVTCVMKAQGIDRYIVAFRGFNENNETNHRPYLGTALWTAEMGMVDVHIQD